MNVYLPGTGLATQGPCDSGFHVPLSTEWEGLKTIMSGLGLTTGDNWRINLHIPFAGNRNLSTVEHSRHGLTGYYWSSSPRGSDYPYYARILLLTSSSVSATDSGYRAYGYSVRCFKDSFELPTSSWTVITGTLGGAGIFRNQTEGLISITSNGTTGYTIQDKNLGSTTVYNDGNTLSEANCGKYYQRGNNYGFSWTGTVTTSSIQVNAQNYGPGNYYSSSKFITRSSSPYDWSSVQNDNLRGGVDGNVQVMSGLKNAYIGEYSHRIAYYPLTSSSTTSDISGNNNNLTNYGVTFGTYKGVDCAYFQNNTYMVAPLVSNQTTLTVLGWLYMENVATAGYNSQIFRWGTGLGPRYDGSSLKCSPLSEGYSMPLNSGWVHYAFTYDGSSTAKFYVNGSLISTKTNASPASASDATIGRRYDTASNNNFMVGGQSNIIVENKVWSATEISNYYNSTKSNYGL